MEENEAAKLPNNEGKVTLEVAQEPSSVAERLRCCFNENGVLFNIDSAKSNLMVKGLMGCGTKHLNPAFVTITLKELENKIEVTINAFAKEGLLKQRSGE